jgi:hypothetical protein
MDYSCSITAKNSNAGKKGQACEIIKTGETGSIRNNKYGFVCKLIFLIILLSCETETTEFQGKLPEDPVNLADFNSEYDDFNSTAPSLGRLIPFCFSTNRNSNGDNFDVIYQPMNINFHKSSGILKITNEYDNWGIYMEDYEIIRKALTRINTSGNELGPYLLYNQNSDLSGYELLLIYSTDAGGNFNINYTFNLDRSDFSDPRPVEFLNSGFNDIYPVFNIDFSRIYFCSDRDGGKFDIFYVELDTNTSADLVEKLSDPDTHEIFKDDLISSQYDDKCPYIFGNIMVFASNRPGGFGGYDLYYSMLENGQWSAPVNFGEKINTPYDEYRPVLLEEDVDYSKYMMIFSSDRPGGKGGFDLYFVGIEK